MALYFQCFFFHSLLNIFSLEFKIPINKSKRFVYINLLSVIGIIQEYEVLR